MTQHPILLVGGSGIIGRATARFLRQAHPDLPLLIGGRDPAKAAKVAAGIGGAEGVALDLDEADLGLGARPVSAVALFFKDDALAGLRFAQSRRVPHLSISSGVQEMGPEVAAHIHAPDAAPIVLGTDWLVGATSIPTLHCAEAFSQVREIAIGALVDEQDMIGPEADIDLERLLKTMPAALTRRDGKWIWRKGNGARTAFHAADGTRMEATAYATFDVLGLASATGAPDVRFDLATGVTSSRRRGEPMSTEIVIELAGLDHAGRPLRTRHAVIHPGGQVPLTALGVGLILERLLGLDGSPPTPTGLYFPYRVLDPAAYLARFERIGGRLVQLAEA